MLTPEASQDLSVCLLRNGHLCFACALQPALNPSKALTFTPWLPIFQTAVCAGLYEKPKSITLYSPLVLYSIFKL